MNIENHTNRFAELRKLAFFEDFDDNNLDYVSRYTRVKTYAQGQVIFQQGDVCTSLQILMSGSINVYFASTEGREVVVSELKVGDLLGEVEIISNCFRQANAVAVKTTRLLTIEKSTFEDMLHLPAFAMALTKSLSGRLHQVVAFAEGVTIYSLQTRLARLLVNMGQTYGKHVSDGILIDRNISQSQLGQLINASRPKINAQLQAWKYENLIRVRNNQITILDHRSLQALSRQDVYSS